MSFLCVFSSEKKCIKPWIQIWGFFGHDLIAPALAALQKMQSGGDYSSTARAELARRW